MVYVVDAIMGSGKTTAAINYINSHFGEKIMYVTPYVDEAKRIQQNCERRGFAVPSEIASVQHNGKPTKYSDLVRLVEDGRNIATTHSLYKRCDPPLLAKIKEQGYTLIIDENIDCLETNERLRNGDIYNSDTIMENSKDVMDLCQLGYLVKVKEYTRGESRYIVFDKNPEKPYGSTGCHANLFKRISARGITVCLDKDDLDPEERIFEQVFWSLRPEVLSSFRNVFIMTYLFEYQGLYYLIKANNIEYKTIGIIKENEELNFNFGDQSRNHIPEWTKHLDSLIDILDNKALNAIGEKRCALSINWFTKNTDGCVEVARKNLKNLFTNYFKDSAGDKKGGGKRARNKSRLWGSCKKGQEMLKGNGYASSFLPFNARATNEYKEAYHLAYMANIFINKKVATIYKNMGIVVNEEQYALSTMIQWIWRSAIRDGKPIRIYIPSKRMRELLIKWIEDLKNGGTGRCVTAKTVGGSGRTSATKKREVKTAATNQ